MLENVRCKLNEILLIIFVFICVFFPYDIFNLKKISFILLILFNLDIILKRSTKRENLMISFFGIIFPTLIIIISILISGQVGEVISRCFCMYMILIIYIINYFNIKYEKIFMKIIFFLCIFILFLAIMDIFGIKDINSSNIRDFIYKYKMGFIGKSSQYSFYYKIFLRTSPLIVILFFYYIKINRRIMTILALVTLVLTGTRANVGFTLICLFMYFVVKYGKRLTKKSILILYFIILVTSILMLIFLPNIINRFIILSKGSDIVRNGHIKGILDLIKYNPSIIFTGMGIGTKFFSYSRGFVDSIELSYIDLIRQIGLPFFLIYMNFLVYPIIKIKTNKIIIWGYIAYLMIAGTNPLLINSTGYVVYIYIYTLLLEERKSRI